MTTLFYEPFTDRAKQLAAALSSAGRTPRQAGTMLEMAELLEHERRHQLVVLGAGVPLAEALSFASEQRLVRPTLGVLLLRDQLDVAVMGEALRAGVREVIAVADVDGISAACARSLDVSLRLVGQADKERDAPPPKHGKIVTVFAGKGGCGKSTVSTNLAVALANGGARKVLLVDLDLSFGDVAIMLQLVPERSLVDGVPMAGRLDEPGLRGLLTSYGPGLDTLLAPIGPADGERISKDLVSETLRVARQMFDYIVIDTPPFFSDQVLAALDASDWFVLLATPDIQTLKNLRLTLDMFDLLEYPKEQRLVVLNYADARVGLTPADIERVVRSQILCHIPSTRDVPISINKGIPLVVERPSHPVSKAIRDFAEGKLITPEEASAGPSPSGEPAASASTHRRRSSFLRRGK